MVPESQSNDLVETFLRGGLPRRAFIRYAALLGVSAGLVREALAARSVMAQDAVPQPTGPREAGTPAADDAQILRLVVPAAFRMDPPTHNAEAWQLQMMVYQALTRVQIDGEIGPGVADSWESNADGSVWTFHINPNAKFSDGTPLTANDVKWTYEWIANPASKSVSADIAVGRISGAQAVRDGTATAIDGIVVKDDHTIEFTLTGPTIYFPALAGQLSVCILKGDNVTSGGEEWWRAPVTSGFFKVTEYTPGDQTTMTLERNEHWFREPAKLARVTVQLIADPQTQLVMYDNGEIDAMPCQPAEFAQATKPDGERSAELFWDIADATWYFGFAIFKPPFDDVKVRQAFASAIDREAISIAGLNGIYPPQPRMLRAGFPGGGDEQWQPTYDVERAKQLLSESTYGSAEALGPITIVISEAAGATAISTWGRVATIIQQQLQENLGVQVELVRQVFESVAEQVEFINATQGGAIFRLSIGPAVLDPSYIAGLVTTGASGNITGYSDPAMDDLIEQANASTDEAERLALYGQIDKKMSEEAIFLAPFRGTSTWFFKPIVRGMAIVQGNVYHSLHQIYISA
jgi:oligopeptide transport system substrate-binding protein